MNLIFNRDLANRYKSASQRARILSEGWVKQEIYCPSCGKSTIERYANNKPVADFYCVKCNEDFELKSKGSSIGDKIVDGSYQTMMERLSGVNNPNLFLLNYRMSSLQIVNFFVVPKHFFVPDVIEKRKPLAETARRRGWIGCNILLHRIPQSGRIFLVKNAQIESKEKVLNDWRRTLFLREEKKVESKGWLLDIMKCVEEIKKDQFSLVDIYKFEGVLSRLHPNNGHIKDKIRQQLQILRDRNYIRFLGSGEYCLA